MMNIFYPILGTWLIVEWINVNLRPYNKRSNPSSNRNWDKNSDGVFDESYQFQVGYHMILYIQTILYIHNTIILLLSYL